MLASLACGAVGWDRWREMNIPGPLALVGLGIGLSRGWLGFAFGLGNKLFNINI